MLVAKEVKSLATGSGCSSPIMPCVSTSADANALDSQRYDIVTIAAVADLVPTLLMALQTGGKSSTLAKVTSFAGTVVFAGSAQAS